MNIMVTRNWITRSNKRVDTYSGSIVRVLREKGHEVVDAPKSIEANYDGVDLVLDIDCGRNEKGELLWQAQEGKLPVPSAVMFIDSHGWPTVHHRVGKNYDHVFYAVWDKRDLFAGHSSAHWCPNFTDLKWFDGKQYAETCEKEAFDFGFFGSKGGLSRANPMVEIAKNNGWTVEARQVGPGIKHRWPQTAEAMAQCRHLFNHCQKHDGPNLRVVESMLMMKPLINDIDARSGTEKLFRPGVHFIPYHAYSHAGLEVAMRWVMDNPNAANVIAASAYLEVKQHHLVENRVDQILEVVQS
jgi:hypothetical protein